MFDVLRKLTGKRSLKDEVSDLRAENAAISKAQAVIEFDMDGTIITARDPAALPAMMKRFLERLEA